MTNLAHEMSDEINAKELAKREGIGIRAIGIPYAKFRAEGHPLFASQFDCNAPLSPEQIALLRPGKFTAKKTVQKKTKSEAVEPADIAMTPEQGQPNTVAPQGLEVGSVRLWPLWIALAITAGASVPNMVEVTTAMKGSGLVAWAMTGVFTLIPGLLIAARLRGFLWGLVVVGVMGYTAFCNASAIFGGLTALDHGYILQPTVFLEAVTNMLNTDYLNTARALSALMALLIGAIEFVAFKNLAR